MSEIILDKQKKNKNKNKMEENVKAEIYKFIADIAKDNMETYREYMAKSKSDKYDPVKAAERYRKIYDKYFQADVSK